MQTGRIKICQGETKITEPLRKKPHRNQYNKHKQLRIDSGKHGVNPKRTHGFGVWGNERVPFTTRVDKGVKKAFTAVSQRYFGSTCRAIEAYMVSVISAVKTQEINGYTQCLPKIDIGEINIKRNLRPRRKLTRTHTETDTVELEYDVCCFAGCDRPAKTTAFYNNEPRKLCDKHVALLTAEGAASKDWRFY